MKTFLKSTVFSLVILLGTTLGHAQVQISGKLVNTNSVDEIPVPIDGQDVYIYLLEGEVWTLWDVTNTGSTGTYLSSPLGEGTYRVEFSPYNNEAFGLYVREFYDNTTEFGSAAVFEIGSDSTDIVNIDATLYFAQIRGTVTGADGQTPLRNIIVRALRFVDPDWISVAVGESDDNGNYTIGGIAPLEGDNSSDVRLEFEDPTEAYLTAVYSTNGTVTTIEEGTDINVSPSIDSDVINISLEPSADPISPQILGIEPLGGGDFNLLFVGQAGVTFQVQKSLTLAVDSWTEYGDPFLATGEPQAIPVTQEGSKTFWKISQVAP